MLAYLVKQGYSVESTFPAPSELIVPHGDKNGQPWTVSNFDDEAGGGSTSIVEATAKSYNTVYAQIVEDLGARNLTATAEEMGIHASELPSGAGYPSEVLGTSSVSPLEMAAAYATFANDGVFTSPVLITKVTTASGTVLPWPTRTTRQVLTPTQDAIVDYVLRQVVLEGTGVNAGDVGSPVAGKTGTTENAADAWFVGFTPRLTTAVWIGHPSGEVPMPGEQGGDLPAELWHDYMQQALASEPDLAGDFPPAYDLDGKVLTPPPVGTVEFPDGTGTTTTLPAPTTTAPASSTTTTTTSVPSSTTTPSTPPTTATATATTTTPTTTPTTAAPTTAPTTPPHTAPPTTAPTHPPPTTTPSAGPAPGASPGAAAGPAPT
jgi:penicillin-binding protein 1A